MPYTEVSSSQGTLHLRATAEAIPADGQSRVWLLVQTKDTQGNRVSGARVRFATTRGHLERKWTLTDSLGRGWGALVAGAEWGEAVVTARWEELEAQVGIWFHSGGGTGGAEAQGSGPGPEFFVVVHWVRDKDGETEIWGCSEDPQSGPAGGKLRIQLVAKNGGAGVWATRARVIETARHIPC